MILRGACKRTYARVCVCTTVGGECKTPPRHAAVVKTDAKGRSGGSTCCPAATAPATTS